MQKKILIIEDDGIIRENLKTLIKEAGYLVETRVDGISGTQVALQWLPNLILCDILMPGMNGYEVKEKLADDEKTKSIPFIFITAKAEKEDILKGLYAGAKEYIVKPYRAKDILDAVERWIES